MWLLSSWIDNDDIELRMMAKIMKSMTMIGEIIHDPRFKLKYVKWAIDRIYFKES